MFFQIPKTREWDTAFVDFFSRIISLRIAQRCRSRNCIRSKTANGMSLASYMITVEICDQKVCALSERQSIHAQKQHLPFSLLVTTPLKPKMKGRKLK
jgi:hypothetical protein